MTLRPYQVAAIEEVRLKIAAGMKRILIWMPTGAGKTVVFCTILDGVIGKGRKGIMVVRGAALVDQASQRLFREGIDHGCLQANHWNKNRHAPIQLCSIDTLAKRGIVPPADVVIIDEAHLATSKSFMWLVAQYPNAIFIPVTATPFVKSGLRHIAEDYVHPITFRELIDQGYLAPLRYFAPTHVNLDGVEIDSKTGDYKTSQLASAMDGAAIYGDVVRNYIEKMNGAPAILFAVDVKHSKSVAERFVAAGVRAVHIDAETSAGERERVMKGMESGAIQVVTNVGVMTTGVDIPCLRAVILCRPTKSKNLYIQMVGRGTRIHPGKTECFVFDHANNVAAHGFAEDEPLDLDLDGRPPKKKDGYIEPIQCEECYGVFEATDAEGDRVWICPFCGFNNQKQRKEFERKAEEDLRVALVEIKLNEETAKREREISEFMAIAKRRGYQAGWVFHQIKDRFGEDEAKKRWRNVKKQLSPTELHEGPRPSS